MNKSANNTGRFLCLLAALGITLLSGQAHADTSPTVHLQSLLELTQSEPAVTPTIKAWKLKQNTKVLFVENHDLPMIEIAIGFNAGSTLDGSSPGLAAMTTAAMRMGNALKNADDLAKDFDRLGLVVSSGMNKEQAFFKLRSLSEQPIREPALQLLTDMLANPGFHEDGLRRARSLLVAQIRNGLQDPETRAEQRIYDELYPDHPIAHGIYGSPDSLAQISGEQLKAFHQRAYTAANAYMVIVGDLSPEQAQIISRTLADALPIGPALPTAQPAPVDLMQSKTLHLEDDLPQSLLVMAQNALPNHHPDARAARIGLIIFGNILNAQLREKYSATYGVLSDVIHSDLASPWMINLYTPPHYSTGAVAQIKTLFAQYLKEGPSESELATINQLLQRGLPQFTSSNRNMLNELLIMSQYNQPLDFKYKTQQIERLTREQIKAVMNRHFSADTWVTVTVGNTVLQQPLAIAQNNHEDSDKSCKPSNRITQTSTEQLGAYRCCGNVGTPAYQSPYENLSVLFSCPCLTP